MAKLTASKQPHMNVLQFYVRIITEAFSNDKAFQNVLNGAFEHFINLNQRSPEFISLFMDDRLRKGGKGSSEDDAEATLDRVMMLFRYLQEKDVFEKYYKQHLAKRLLSGRVVLCVTSVVPELRAALLGLRALCCPDVPSCFQKLCATYKVLNHIFYSKPRLNTIVYRATSRQGCRDEPCYRTRRSRMMRSAACW